MIKNNSENFRNRLVEMVKASGQEVIDRAEDLVGSGGEICDFDIWLRFSIGAGMFDACPTIEVTRSHISKQAVDMLINKEEVVE